MTIEAIRKMLAPEPSPLVLHISPFLGLHRESSIYQLVQMVERKWRDSREGTSA